ncbi:hypothetical protein [Bradyrhizobium yuanmingense]|uniref:hypothetical protein n=1 Tax=Bradyrhizobium yuanmingense TaxID=108015 RepID=UPI0012FBE9EE|nr:hypothetical protein [Bradyrhizobium yuanmingense]
MDIETSHRSGAMNSASLGCAAPFPLNDAQSAVQIAMLIVLITSIQPTSLGQMMM